jgi:hypothetical protein
MSQSYSEIPPGGITSIPPSIPTGMLYRVKSLSGISKQTLKFPLSGQTVVTNGGKIIVALPPSSLVDLIPERLDSAAAEKKGDFPAAAED